MTVYDCLDCGKTYTAQPAFCRCGDRQFRSRETSGRGRVYSCTTLYAAAEAFEKDLPFQIAIVVLDGGGRLTARIAGAPVAVGAEVLLREQRDGVYFFAAV